MGQARTGLLDSQFFKDPAKGLMKVEDRLNAIERELAEIKAALSCSRPPRAVRLKGLWKGLRVDDADLAKAQKSLFKHSFRLDRAI